MPKIACALVALFVLPACSLFQGDVAQTTIDDLRDLRGELTKGTVEIAAVTEALDTLTTEGGDMRKEYESYCDAVDDVEDQAEDVDSIRRRVAGHREDYLELWQQQLGLIRDDDLRQRSSDRRDEVAGRFNALKADGEEIRSAFDTWLQTLRDIRLALKFDLNPEGVAAVGKKSDRISKEADDIVAGIERFEQSLDRLVEKLEASKPPEPQDTDS